MSQFLLAEIVANPFNTTRIFDYTNIGHEYGTHMYFMALTNVF